MTKDLPGASPVIIEKFEALKHALAARGRGAIAFSGGVDSAFLLAAAARSGMDRLLAITLVSPFFTREEVARTKSLSEALGVEHLCLELDILSDDRVVQNDARRCYYCKQSGFSAIKAAAGERGIETLIHGINLDDLRDYRPGIEAARELGFEAPLVDAGFTKQEIREASKAMGLSTWDLPSQSCLATRIPQGDPITADALERVAQAENILRDLGFPQVRVRCHGALARIEVPEAQVSQMNSPALRRQISKALNALGFAFVALDLEGYASGKMNQKR
jgi:uncharacterized protein